MYLNCLLTKIPVNKCVKLNTSSPICMSSLITLLNGDKHKVQISTACTMLQEESSESALPLTKDRAQELVMRLNVEERGHLQTTLHEIESDKMKDEYKGEENLNMYLLTKYIFVSAAFLQKH